MLSAILMMGFMMAYSSVTGAGVTMPLKALGALVYGVEALVAGSMAMLAGAGIQLGFSIVLGILFALFISRRTSISSGAVCRDRGWNRHLGGDGFGRAAIHEPDDGGANRADAAGVLHRAPAVRHRSRNDPRLHPDIQQEASRPIAAWNARQKLYRFDRASAAMRAYRKHSVLLWIGGIFATLIVALFIASFFLDDIIRARTQAAMNQKLKGYHVALAHAHLQLVGGILTLNGLKIIQQAHPHPAVADVPMMRFHIQGRSFSHDA